MEPNRTLRPQQAPSIPDDLSGGERVALVIGNADYATAPLKNPVNDARAMAAALSGCHFKVITLENANIDQMWDGLRRFSDELHDGVVGLFHFIGLDMQVKGKTFLIPAGSDIRFEDKVLFKALFNLYSHPGFEKGWATAARGGAPSKDRGHFVPVNSWNICWLHRSQEGSGRLVRSAVFDLYSIHA